MPRNPRHAPHRGTPVRELTLSSGPAQEAYCEHFLPAARALAALAAQRQPGPARVAAQRERRRLRQEQLLPLDAELVAARDAYAAEAKAAGLRDEVTYSHPRRYRAPLASDEAARLLVCLERVDEVSAEVDRLFIRDIRSPADSVANWLHWPRRFAAVRRAIEAAARRVDG
jgi:hypothetical protein